MEQQQQVIRPEEIIRLHDHQRLEIDNYVMFCSECWTCGPSNAFDWRCPIYKEAVSKLTVLDDPVIGRGKRGLITEPYLLQMTLIQLGCDHKPSQWTDPKNMAICLNCKEAICNTEIGWVTYPLARAYNLV